MEGRELSRTSTESSEESSETVSPHPRFCFCIPRFGSSTRQQSPPPTSNWWQKIRPDNTHDGSLWTRGVGAFKKLREWSEIVAGPRWKTFIRRFNRNNSGGGGGRHVKFIQYDPMSYALNFDKGQIGNSGEVNDDDDYMYRNFSSRYAAVPISGKTSMDLAKDGPSFV